MNLLTCYEAAIERAEIKNDPLQREVLITLQGLLDHKRKWYNKQRQGLYLYGPVGAGKSYLIDLFFQHLPEKKKARFHFHHFMQQMDSQLRKLQGTKNPLIKMAKTLAKTTRILCFDEFFVQDVAHAMILAQFLQALIDNGVMIIISSNTHPDDLYKNGVQRDRFLPAIALIKRHCEVRELSPRQDYRRGRRPRVNAYLYPLNQQTTDSMEQQFSYFAKESHIFGTITIQQREIPYVKCNTRTIWFDFNRICALPRSQLDYLEIATRFDVIFLSDIPAGLERHATQALLFIYFVDVLYDRRIKLIISAEVAADELYQTGALQEPFKRTLSRLHEMQSEDYLSR